MKETLAEVVKVVTGGPAKGAALMTVLWVSSMLWHAASQVDQQGLVQQQQAVAVQSLADKVDKRDIALTEITITVARVEGKLDVLNQKLDDKISTDRGKK